MVNLLEQIRAALDTLEPQLEGRVVDVEMPRLFVDADAEVAGLRRCLVALIERGLAQYDGTLTVRTTKQRGVARVEVTGERRALAPTVPDWSDTVTSDVAALRGSLETDGPSGWLSLPLAGANAPE